MDKRYSQELMTKMKEKQTITKIHGVDVIVKNLPDCDEKGAMDPRLYEDSKKMLKMLPFMPKFMLKMDTSPKGIEKLREMFNGVKSISCVNEKVNVEDTTVKAEDGYDIPVRIYHSENPIVNGPVLYYIHGGGFFGGHIGVVEESLKMLTTKTNIPVVTLNYRLAPENPFPIGHQDCYTVLKWVYENAEKLGVDKHNIFVAGDSAGGNLTQYCTTRSYEDGVDMVKGQMLLYPTVNMAGVKDEFFDPEHEVFEMAPSQKKGLTKMLSMFAGMTSGLETILGTSDVNNDYLNPYTRDAAKNPVTFVTVGEHDFLKTETLGYAAKLHRAGVETKVVLYKGMGHAYFDNTGVYPQCEDCIDEMGQFILDHSK